MVKSDPEATRVLKAPDGPDRGSQQGDGRRAWLWERHNFGTGVRPSSHVESRIGVRDVWGTAEICGNDADIVLVCVNGVIDSMTAVSVAKSASTVLVIVDLKHDTVDDLAAVRAVLAGNESQRVYPVTVERRETRRALRSSVSASDKAPTYVDA